MRFSRSLLLKFLAVIVVFCIFVKKYAVMKRTLFLLALAVALLVQAQPIQVKVMTFNIHAGHDASLHEIADLIVSEAPDFVALQEVDCNTHRANSPHQNGRDFIAELAHYSGMMGLYCPTIRFSGGYYGIGLLTKHPYIKVENLMLPNPNAKMEQRAILEATVVLPSGDTLMVASTHLEAFDASCRQAQGQYISERYATVQYPTIIAGDFNAAPSDSVITDYIAPCWLNCTDSQPTFSTQDPTQKIDYIFAQPRDAWTATDSRVIPCNLSDHLPVTATLRIR